MSATEEFWEETEIDENGVEGETRRVDAEAPDTTAAAAKPKPKPKAARKKSSDVAAAAADDNVKPKKKSKKAAGTRDIMCVQAPLALHAPPPSLSLTLRLIAIACGPVSDGYLYGRELELFPVLIANGVCVSRASRRGRSFFGKK
jgi:hypothetical protein